MSEAPVFLEPDRLPGEILFEHPQDVAAASRTRLWEVHEVLMPDGDVRWAGLAGEWGRAYDVERFRRLRARLLDHLTRLGRDDGYSGTACILGTQYRLERAAEA